MKMAAPAPALPPPPKRAAWRALPVLALVLLSMLVPLLFVLNHSGCLEDDQGSHPRFERHDLDENQLENKKQADENDKTKHVADIIKHFEPNLKKDLVETLTKEPASGRGMGSIVTLASDPRNETSGSESKAVPTLETSSTPDTDLSREKLQHVARTKEAIAGTDENKNPCQLEFGSYCIWRDEHREQMKDAVVKKLKDQLFVARAYYPSIAKIPSQDKLTREMKTNIQEYERMLSETTSDSDLPPLVEKKIEKMETVIAQAKVFPVECSNVERKLRQILELTEDEAYFHMRQSAFLYQLAVHTMPKSLHCLSMRLTVEYFRLNSKNTGTSHKKPKQEDPTFRHYVIFSKHILAASVVINSTVMHSKDTVNQVFHVITDRQNYFAMKFWFYRNQYKNATIKIMNVEDTHINILSDEHKLRYILPSEFIVSVGGRSEYLSLFGSAHFLLPYMFPTLTRLVILDDDIVVQQDLSTLWDLDMEGKVNGALQYCGLTHRQLKNQLQKSTVDDNACLWMSGVNVIDLEKWKEHNVTQTYLNYIQPVMDGTEKSDSTILFRANLLTFEGLTYPLDMSLVLPGLGHDYGIDLESIKKSSVLHYSGVMKPWLDVGIHYYKSLWKKYLKRDDEMMDSCNVNS